MWPHSPHKSLAEGEQLLIGCLSRVAIVGLVSQCVAPAIELRCLAEEESHGCCYRSCFRQ